MVDLPTMKPSEVTTGLKINFLTSIQKVHNPTGLATLWLWKCDCGKEKVIAASHVLSRSTKSCGCYLRSRLSEKNYIHGMSYTKEHMAWTAALTRCYNTKNKAYPNWGGRGITVCDRWRFGEGGLNGFQCFFQDMGPAPSKSHSLHRKDNDGNYEPGNCIWGTKKIQSQGRRNSVMIEFRGEVRCLTDWCERLGLKMHAIHKRIKAGWPTDLALTTPVLYGKRVFKNLSYHRSRQRNRSPWGGS